MIVKQTALTVPARESLFSSTETGLVDTESQDYSYHDDFTRLSATMIKQFRKNRGKFRAIYVDRTEPPMMSKRHMDLGSIVHAVFLEKKAVEDFVGIYPRRALKSNGDINSKPAALFERQNPQFEFFRKPTEMDQIHSIVSAIENHSIAKKWMLHPRSLREQPLFWVDEQTGMPCRCQVDFVLETKTRMLAFDLKVTVNYSADAFSTYLSGNRKGGMRGWVQAAHYSSGIQATFGKPVEMRFVTVNPDTPHQIGVHQLDGSTSHSVVEEYRKTMHDIAECRRNGDWREAWEKTDNKISMAYYEIT